MLLTSKLDGSLAVCVCRYFYDCVISRTVNPGCIYLCIPLDFERAFLILCVSQSSPCVCVLEISEVRGQETSSLLLYYVT